MIEKIADDLIGQMTEARSVSYTHLGSSRMYEMLNKLGNLQERVE